METATSVSILNDLIEINNDRIEGYKTAVGETQTAALKAAFGTFIRNSEQNLNELFEEVTKINGKPEEGTRATGKLYRAWMEVRAALSGNSDQQILSSCEFGEDKALEVYEHVLTDHTTQLSAEQIAVVRAQQSKLRADHDKVKSLRDAE